MLMRRKYPPEQLAEAEGRHCVLVISGLRYHEKTIFFTVEHLMVRVCDPYDSWDAHVQAPLSVVNDLLGRVLSGQKGAFGDIAASNQARISGKRAPHDLLVWENVFDELAANIARVR